MLRRLVESRIYIHINLGSGRLVKSIVIMNTYIHINCSGRLVKSIVIMNTYLHINCSGRLIKSIIMNTYIHSYSSLGRLIKSSLGRLVKSIWNSYIHTNLTLRLGRLIKTRIYLHINLVVHLRGLVHSTNTHL